MTNLREAQEAKQRIEQRKDDELTAKMLPQFEAIAEQEKQDRLREIAASKDIITELMARHEDKSSRVNERISERLKQFDEDVDIVNGCRHSYQALYNAVRRTLVLEHGAGWNSEGQIVQYLINNGISSPVSYKHSGGMKDSDTILLSLYAQKLGVVIVENN